MRVSVIVPLYNKAKYVIRAMSSIAHQTFSDFEAIVVDDGSTDGSAELAAAYPDARFRVLRQSNAGPGAARNRGIEQARGELIAFLDADDDWLPEYLDTNVRLLNSQGGSIAAVTSGYCDFPEGTSRETMWRRRGLTEGIQQVTPETPVRLLIHMLAYMWPCSTVARAAAVRRWGGFYEKDGCRYAEDALLWLKVLLNEPVYFHFRPLARFHREASALSSNYHSARPVEPFLVDPDEVAAACPEHLQRLLRDFYAARACKTAGMLGYWGEWRKARELFGRFASAGDWRLPFFAQGLLGCTPLAAIVGPALVAARRPFQRARPAPAGGAS